MNSVLIVLVCTQAFVGADRYSDYAGVSMPHYNMEEESRDVIPPAEDYVDRSPDAPVPFDYKYEEELRDKGNKMRIKTEEENWDSQSNILKQPPNSPDDDQMQHEDTADPKSLPNRKHRRHRTRIKTNELDRETISYKLKAGSKIRNRKINKETENRNNYYASKGRKREDNRIESDGINLRDTTEKLIRRKPRDRSINLRRVDVDDVDEDDDNSKTLERDDIKHLVRDDDGEYPDMQKANSRRFMVERPVRPIEKMEKTKIRNKNYPEYDDDYYDLKRINDMKNKMPDLLRRTQASTMEKVTSRLEPDFSHRRANVPETTTEASTKSTSATTEPTTPTKLTNVIPIDPPKSVTITNTTELSLAEKSRLSILKKAQRKDDIKNATLTTKPPVLMQVTRRMQTLVMVEPPQDVRLRAREVVEDSPERIARAKKLMRRKLVAGARSIHDLTDNWDEMVCDYIDVSLLDSSAKICFNFELLLSLTFINMSYLYLLPSF